MATSIVSKCTQLFPNILRLFSATASVYQPQGVHALLAGRCSQRYLFSRAFPLSQLLPQRSVSHTETEETSLSKSDDSPSNIEDPYAEDVELCLLCKANIPVSYKNPKLLSQFVSPNTGRIYSRQITKLCQMQHERVTRAITMSRMHGFMPVMYRETFFLKDPNLFDVKYTGNTAIGEHIKFPGRYSSGEEPIPLVSKKMATDKPKTRKRDKPKLSKTEKRKSKSR